MGNPFWMNRINPLRKDRPAPNVLAVGAWAVGAGGAVTTITGDGTITDYPDLGAFVAAATAQDGPAVWYTHVRQREDLARQFDDAGAMDALMDAGRHVRLFQSQGHTAALEVFPDADPAGSTGKPVDHWSFRNLGVLLPGASVPRNPRDAALQTARRVTKLQLAVHERFGTHLEMTATRTGYMGWRRTLDTYHWRQPRPARRDIRKAYRGGYTRAFTTEQHRGGTWRQYDIRSAYPAAMRRGVPLGQPVAVGPDYDLAHPDTPAFYEIEAIIPRDGLPVLMAWTPDEGDVPLTMGAPTRVWATSQELQLARTLGVIARTLGGWAYPDGLGSPFDAFVDIVEPWRGASTGADNRLVKLIQNTLYGKFGTDPEQKEVIITPETPKEPEWMPYYGASAPVDCAWYRMVDADARAGQMIHWAAWITASVRCHVIRTIAQLGPANVLYVDTDCIITSGELVTGTRYGDWVLERVYESFQAFAGKRYYGRTVDGQDIIKHAGIAGDVREDAILELMEREFHGRDPG